MHSASQTASILPESGKCCGLRSWSFVVAADVTRVPKRSCGKSGRCRFFGSDGSRDHPRERAHRNSPATGSPVRQVPRVQVLGFRSSNTYSHCKTRVSFSPTPRQAPSPAAITAVEFILEASIEPKGEAYEKKNAEGVILGQIKPLGTGRYGHTNLLVPTDEICGIGLKLFAVVRRHGPVGEARLTTHHLDA
jgi:hypothetical protein